MQLKSALSLPSKGIFSIIGGGGKSSAISLLANEFLQDGKTVIQTTTTHIAAPDIFPPHMLIENDAEPIYREKVQKLLDKYPSVICAKKSDNPLKLSAPSFSFLEHIKGLADVVLIEADGARHLPFKAPADHEPVVLPDTDWIIGVAGMDALNHPIQERCHRPEQICSILNISPGTKLTSCMMAEIILSQDGYQKCVTKQRKFSLILNKCDTPEVVLLAQEVKKILKRKGSSFPIALTSFHNNKIF